MNDFRPVALTSVAMKVLKRFILDFLKSLINSFMDPLQFAYFEARSTEDAILFCSNKIYSHHEITKSNVSARIMFFDYSSAFYTIHLIRLVRNYFI